MANESPQSPPFGMTRRELLARSGVGMGMLALAGVAADDRATGATQTAGAVANPLAPKEPHFRPRAKRVIHFFLNGGPSHVDLFDPKPALAKYVGKPLPVSFRTERKTGAALPTKFKFSRHGDSGLEMTTPLSADRRARRRHCHHFARCMPKSPITSLRCY